MASAQRRFLESINDLEKMVQDHLEAARTELERARADVYEIRDDLRRQAFARATDAADDLVRISPSHDSDGPSF